MNDPHLYAPYPEIVERKANPRSYVTLDSTLLRQLPSRGMVDLLNRLIYTPWSDAGRRTVMHEYGHVLWSPRKLPKLDHDPSILLAVEDARVNDGLAHYGEPLVLTAHDKALLTLLAGRDVAEERYASFVLRAIASIGNIGAAAALADVTAAPRWLLELTQGLVATTLEELERSRRRTKENEVASFECAVRIAAYVARTLERRGLLTKDARPALHVCICSLVGGAAKPATDSVAVRLMSGVGHGDGRSGKLRIVEAKLETARPGARGPVRERRATREGAYFVRPDRYCIDQAVFCKSRQSSGGGSVLVDGSGSMQLDAKGVDRIIAAAPSATLIALYSGAADAGELRIVARGGRRASAAALKPSASGNVVDVPALTWLAGQRAPRVWVSDGRVTGIGDKPSPIIEAQCRSLCRKAKIIRVKSADQAAKVLAGKAPPQRQAA